MESELNFKLTTWSRHGKKYFHFTTQGEEGKHAYHTPIEIKVNAVLTPFQQYIKHQITASAFLTACTFIALLWASIPSFSDWYNAFINSPIGFHVANFHISNSLRFWVNNSLLALFFFFIGLEIKRELLVGDLAPKNTVFVIFAAAGGMLVLTALYWLINFNQSTQFSWAIPMATDTDTTFALGILSFF